MTTLTSNELSLFKDFAHCEYNPTNGNLTYAKHKEDLSTYLFLSDRNCGDAKTNASRRGILGSLIKKKLVETTRCDEEQLLDFTEKGFNLAKELFNK